MRGNKDTRADRPGQHAKKHGSRPKVNPLRPAEREKKRYVAFEILSEKPLPPGADRQLVERLNSFLGVFEASKAGLLRVRYDPAGQRGLLRVDRKYVDALRSCFVMTKELLGLKVLVRTLSVSGMLNNAAAAAAARAGSAAGTRGTAGHAAGHVALHVHGR